MRHSTLIFVVAAFALLTLSRLALAAWQWQRVRNAGGLFPLLLGGLRIDAHQIAVLAALPAVLSPLLGHFPIAATIAGYWYLVAFILLAFLEVASPPFILEYDSRPNRLFVEYLKHPREVSGMLWRGYKLALLGGLGGALGDFYSGLAGAMGMSPSIFNFVLLVLGLMFLWAAVKALLRRSIIGFLFWLVLAVLVLGGLVD